MLVLEKRNDKHEFGRLSIYENSYEVTKKEIREKWKIEICKKFLYMKMEKDN